MQQLWSEMLLLEGLSVDLFQVVTNTESVKKILKQRPAHGLKRE
jgi:hypothetical protein